MTNYNPGDVILVNIAFSGAVGYKRRPAVIISKDRFNTAGIKLINNFFSLGGDTHLFLKDSLLL